MPPTPHLTARERYVLGRIVRAEGEPQIVDSVRFSEGAVERGIAAIRRGATIVTDVRMVEVGTSKALLARAGNPITTMIDAPSVAQRAKRAGITRSAAACSNSRRSSMARSSPSATLHGSAGIAGRRGRTNRRARAHHRHARRLCRMRRGKGRDWQASRGVHHHSGQSWRQQRRRRNPQRSPDACPGRKPMTTTTPHNHNGGEPDAAWGVILLAHGSQRGSHTIDGLREMGAPAARATRRPRREGQDGLLGVHTA